MGFYQEKVLEIQSSAVCLKSNGNFIVYINGQHYASGKSEYDAWRFAYEKLKQ